MAKPKGLVIAEKPSERRVMEKVYKDHVSEIPYDLTFMEQRGHLLTLKLPDELDEEQKSWCWENLPFHPEDHGGWQYKVIQEKKVGKFLTAKERFYAIKDELSSGDYDFVVNAGDPDQEGELLVRMVLSGLKNKLPVKRYWTNATTELEVLDALKNLRDDDKDPMLVNLLAAAYGRQHSDYRFGMNITRAASLKMGSTVACGRVKTPILSIVCKREKEIKDFTPTTCYGVVAKYGEDFTGQLYDASTIEAEVSTEEGKKGEGASSEEKDAGIVWFDTKEEAMEVIDALSRLATVVSYETNRETKYAPKLFKLATAQIAAGKLGYDSSQTLEIIQSLYEKGYLTYPRTDCEYLSSKENFSAMLNAASSVPALKPFIDKIDPSVIGKVKSTKKWVNDKQINEAGHTALVPTTSKPKFESLSPDEQAIYQLVCTQFVAIFLPPMLQDKTVLIADIDGKTFKSNGKTLIDPGYTTLLKTKITDVEIPKHASGDRLSVDSFDVSTKTTTCPKRFTDADLIAACETPHKYLNDPRLKALGKRLSIGTPATRASIIKELIEKNRYLQVVSEKKAKYVVPTDVGMTIYENLKDLDICKIDLTGQWEEKLEMVRKGAMSLADLEVGMKAHVEELVNDIKSNTDMEVIKSAAKREIVCKCPSCGGNIISGNKGFYCSNYKSGCQMGAFKSVCDTVIKDSDFANMIAGKIVNVVIKKGEKKWPQDLKYNAETHKIEFVQAPPSTSKYKCPKCGKELTEDARKYYCSSSCGFQFWKMAAGKVLTGSQIEKFFTTGSTGLVKGMKSKSGKTFDAKIVLNAEKTGTSFEFE